MGTGGYPGAGEGGPGDMGTAATAGAMGTPEPPGGHWLDPVDTTRATSASCPCVRVSLRRDSCTAGRHYGDSEKPRCGGCDELIFSNEYTQAEDQNWHLKHFCCFDCDCVLAGETYVMENNKPVCKPCYMKSHAAVCTACQNPVEPEAQRVSYGDFHWHAEPQCFQCSCCAKCLIGERFMAIQGMLFCSVECKKKTMT
ncbi:hypothetical protein J4Q44_G00111890 [Coregonus suidteri]|uniref:LIM zinc-binding domain-containing protein n=1 Tax=Coregonus suidteri TaxID=861788 RepID=A0AAN8R0G8_9TELE